MKALLFALGLLPAAAFAQDDLFLYGTLRDHIDRHILANGTVTIEIDGSRAGAIATDSVGHYAMHVNLGSVVRLWYTMPGYVSKNVIIDGRGIPVEKALGGFGMEIDITLFGPRPGVDEALMEAPMGKAKYDPEQDQMAWDLAYTEQAKQRLVALAPELARPVQDTSHVAR